MKNEYPELDVILEKNKIQKNIYQPSSFWRSASANIVTAIKMGGVENFRNLEVPLGYFVPNYGIPANSFDAETKSAVTQHLSEIGSKKQCLAMEEFLSGYFHALSDYRVFLASDLAGRAFDLTGFSESSFGNPIEQFNFDGKAYSRSALNYLLGLCFLKHHLSEGDEINTVLEIGGGFGTLGEILHASGGKKYINVDIPPMSYISHTYLSHVYSSDEVEPYLHEYDVINIDQLKPCSVFSSWDIELLEGEVDLFVNFISFQEMEPDIVANYMKYVQKLKPKYILLRNIREGKQLKKTPEDAGVEVPIVTDDYIKMISEKYSLKASNVIPFGYKTVDGFHSELLLFKRRD